MPLTYLLNGSYSNTEKQHAFGSFFMKRDFRIPFDFDKAQTLLDKDSSTITLSLMIDEAIIDFCDLLRNVIDDSGLSRAEMCRMWNWDPTQMSKSLRPNMTRGIPYEVLLSLANACGCSVSNLLYHRETEIPVLRKYKLLFAHLKTWNCKAIYDVIDQINCEARSETGNNPTNEYIRNTVCRRLLETADDRGSSPYYLIESSMLRGKLRPTLDVLAEEKKYVAKMWQTTLLISVGTGLSPDFLMRKDYPAEIQQIALLSGEQYVLRECDKALWLALLNCSSTEAENTWIGKLLSMSDM